MMHVKRELLGCLVVHSGGESCVLAHLDKANFLPSIKCNQMLHCFWEKAFKSSQVKSHTSNSIRRRIRRHLQPSSRTKLE